MSKAAVRANWSVTTLGQIAGLVMGKTPPRNEKQYWTDALTHPFCTIADMEGKWIHPKREGVTSTALQNAKARKVSAGSLMMSFKLTIGRVGFAGVDLYPNEAIVAIDVNPNISTKEYLYLVLGSQDLTHGSGRAIKGATLNSASLAAIPLLLPPLSEQKRIVDVLASVDAYIAALQQQAADAQTTRNAVLHELLTAGGDDWAETTLGEVALIQQGQNLAIATLTTGEYPVYGANGIVGHFDRWNSDQEVVALGCRGSCGTVHIVTGKAWLANNVMAIWPKDVSQITASFIALVLETADLRTSGVVSGQVQPQITRTSLSPLILTFPSLSAQVRIVEIVSAMDAVIHASEQAVTEAKNLRSGLLSDLLSGEHEIPATYDHLLGAA